ncbi:hypothetical protein KI387_001517, partial [Taxus chinensis]
GQRGRLCAGRRRQRVQVGAGSYWSARCNRGRREEAWAVVWGRGRWRHGRDSG